MAYYDHGYGCPSVRPRVSDPATYCSSTPRIQLPAVARWHTHLHGLETPIHEICGLASIHPETAFMGVILRSKATKNLIFTGSAEILRGACPELAEGLRMTMHRFRMDTIYTPPYVSIFLNTSVVLLPPKAKELESAT
jgi:hypothetical protein